MKVDISLVLSCLIFSVTGWCLIRQILRKVYRGYWAFYSWAFFIGAFGFSAVDLLMSLGGGLTYGPKVRTGLLGLYAFSFIAVYAFGVMDDPQKNRLRPLTRLPLIGLLLGLALTPYDARIMLFIVEALMLVFAWKTRDRIRYSARAQIKAAFLAPILFVPAGWAVPLWALWSFCFKNAAVNAAIVKGKMLDYDKTFKKDESFNEK